MARGPGVNHGLWNRRNSRGRTVAGGVFFYQVETGRERQQKKVVLTK